MQARLLHAQYSRMYHVKVVHGNVIAQLTLQLRSYACQACVATRACFKRSDKRKLEGNICRWLGMESTQVLDMSMTIL